jgi:hypothetical protein
MGFLVHILGSLYAGRVYLPMVVFVTRVQGMKTAVVGYLPLMGIFGRDALRRASEPLGNMPRKRLPLATLGMTGLFAGLGVLVARTF